MENKSFIKPINWMVLGVVVFMCFINIAYAFIPLAIADNMIVNLIVSEAIFLIPAGIFILICRPNLIRLRRIKISTMLLILLGCCMLAPVVIFLNLLTQLLVPNAAEAMVDAMGGYPAGIIFLTFAIVPPLVEEFLFRGLIFEGYKRTANRLAAVLISALLFGLVHGNLNQTPYAFVLGIFLALLVEATGTIVAPVIAHIAFNGWNVLMMLLVQKFFKYLPDATITNAKGASVRSLFEEYADMLPVNVSLFMILVFTLYFMFAIAFGVLAYLVLKLIANNENRTQSFKALFGKQIKGERIVTVPLIIAAVILLYFLGLSAAMQIMS